MPRFEQDREDIFREATALVERVELRLPDQTDPIVVGFRRDGSPSFFFGAEPVLQFNTSGELRRAYDQGRMLKAMRGRFVALQRVRDEQQVSLISHELTDAETNEFLQRAQQLLTNIREVLDHGTAHISRQVPADADIAGRVRTWLETLREQLPIANRPNVGKGK